MVTTPETERDYRDRFRRVLAHIDTHLDDDLSLDVLARVAAFSRFHFQRQFSAFFGLSAHRYVQLLRLRRASHLLTRGGESSILEVALDSGYQSHEAFSRAFKRAFGQTPAAFRAAPRSAPWAHLHHRLTSLRSLHMQTAFSATAVSIVDFPETRVAAVEHRGDPAHILASVHRLVAWRRAHGLSPERSATFNVHFDDPRTTPPDAFRLDIAVATDLPIAPGDPVVAKLIPGGRCARLRVVGGDEAMEAGFDFLYREWLPASGEEPRDFPPFVQRVRFPPLVAEHESVTDLFVPLAP